MRCNEHLIEAISHAARGIQMVSANLSSAGRRDEKVNLRLQEAALNFKEAVRLVERASKPAE